MSPFNLFGLVFLSISIKPASATSFNNIKLTGYEHHHCIRPCLNSAPMRCEYDFVVEHYHTLSRACYNCPYNVTDCFRSHCIPADGFYRPVKVVNRMMPGPGINVCKDDTVVVNVYNEMYDFEGTSIHWHGILQKGSPEMDGVALVTQCPISSHSAFQYKFKAGNSGTHFWHSHAGLQRGDGVFGSLVVRDTYPTFNMRYYDYDLPEHTVIVHDWLEGWTSARFASHHHANDGNKPRSVLINGRGSLSLFQQRAMSGHSEMGEESNMGDQMGGAMGGKMGVEIVNNTNQTVHTMGSNNESNTVNGTETTYHVIRVKRDKLYRLRFISNGILNCPLRVTIDKHNFTVIATDGNDVRPEVVTAFNIFSGERYDVVVRANQMPGNYWIHVEGLGDCGANFRGARQRAILRYEGGSNEHLSDPTHGPESKELNLLLNPDTFTGNVKTVAEMASLDVQTSIDVPDVKKFFFAMDFNMVENYRFLDPDLYPLTAMMDQAKGAHSKHVFALQLNRISFTFPHAPPLSQYDELSEDIFCNETSTSKDCEHEFCECVHRLIVDIGDMVEFILVGEAKNGMGNHPMHLHGHRFWVVAMEKLNDTITRKEVEKMDTRGEITRNLLNPPQKDTVMVPDGGYTIIRFRADNPGFWLFHCHVDFHFSLGMSVIIQVGHPHRMSQVPRGFPKCGSWKFSLPEEQERQGARNTGNISLTSVHLIMLGIATVVIVIIQLTY